MTDAAPLSIFAFPRPYEEPDDVFAAVAARPWSLFFDSADRTHPLGRYSFIAADPVERITARDGHVTVDSAAGARLWRGAGDPFAVLRTRLSRLGMANASNTVTVTEVAATDRTADKTAGNGTTPNDLPPFRGGAAGFFGYDLARGIEKLPAIAQPSAFMPDMAVGLYDHVIAFDHRTGKSWTLILARDRNGAETRRAEMATLLSAPPRLRDGSGSALSWRTTTERADYESDIGKVISYIRAGDIFQANLSQRFEAGLPPDFDSYAHYRTLRRVNAAPFAAYMNFGDIRLSSASPERFISLQGRRAETRPIKGTARRAADPEQDRKAREALAISIKDRAENTMIVDLLRNDLSRACTDESVDVPRLCGLESFATVHHLVSVVTGTLRAGEDALSLLRTCFPGGSITGAPKIRAMEIIEELEPFRRGPYCGAMGYIGADGTMDTNIAIRTLIYEGDRVHFNVGGGITADSVPAAEYQETLDKAAGIFQSFTPGAQPPQEKESAASAIGTAESQKAGAAS